MPGNFFPWLSKWWHLSLDAEHLKVEFQVMIFFYPKCVYGILRKMWLYVQIILEFSAEFDLN